MRRARDLRTFDEPQVPRDTRRVAADLGCAAAYASAQDHDRLRPRLHLRQMRRIERRVSLRRACELVGDDRRGEQPEPADRDGAQSETEPRPTQAQQQARHADNERTGGRQYQRLREHAKFQPGHVDFSCWLMAKTSLRRHERRCRSKIRALITGAIRNRAMRIRFGSSSRICNPKRPQRVGRESPARTSCS